MNHLNRMSCRDHLIALDRCESSRYHAGLLVFTRLCTLIVATIYLQLIKNRYMFRSFTVFQCSHQHCVQPVASDVEVELTRA